MEKSHVSYYICLMLIPIIICFSSSLIKTSTIHHLENRIKVLDKELMHEKANSFHLRMKVEHLRFNTIDDDMRLDNSVEEEYQKTIDAAIHIASEEFCVDPSLIRAVIWAESRFDQMATSESGEHLGLMQVSTKWHAKRAKELHVSDFYSILGNIRVGTSYLADLIKSYNDTPFALMVYNQGEASATRTWKRLGTYSSYAKTILDKAKEYRKEGW